MKGCLLVFLVVVALIVGGVVFAFHQLTSTQIAAEPSIKVTAQNVADAQQKVDAIQSADQQANAQGKPVPFNETFTDAELSGLINDGLSKSGTDPLGTVVVHAAGNGVIQGWSQVHYSGATLPVYLEATISINDGRQPVVQLDKADMGSVTMPDALRSQLNAALSQQVDLGGGQGYQGVEVKIGVGSITISGEALPSGS